MQRLVRRIRARRHAPARPELGHVFWSALGGGIAIALVAGLASASDTPLLIPPFGATVVLAFAVHESPLAQPRNIIGGHLLASAVGLAFYIGLGDAWWVMALASACAIPLMQVTRTVHPPAGANPILITLGGSADWSHLLMPIAAGTIALVLCAVIFNKLVPGRTYPTSWF